MLLASASADGRWRFFRLLAVGDSAAANTGAQVSV